MFLRPSVQNVETGENNTKKPGIVRIMLIYFPKMKGSHFSLLYWESDTLWMDTSTQIMKISDGVVGRFMYM